MFSAAFFNFFTFFRAFLALGFFCFLANAKSFFNLFQFFRV